MDDHRRILVAGATGVVGRRIVTALVAEGGTTVYGLARSAQSTELIERLGAIPVGGDALDHDAVDRAVRQTRPDTIIHQLTAIPHRAVNPRRMGKAFAATNALRSTGTRNLVEAAERHGVQRLIAQSIAFGYRPEGPMVLAEDAPLDSGARGGWGDVVRAVAELEEAVLSSPNLVGVVLRYGGFYGSGTALAPDGYMGRLARNRRLPVIGSGSGVQSFIHIDDACGAALAALDAPPGTFNVVDDEPLRASEWIPLFASAIGAPEPRHVPAWPMRLLAGDAMVKRMTAQRGASNERIKRVIGWHPAYASFREGVHHLADTVAPRPSLNDLATAAYHAGHGHAS